MARSLRLKASALNITIQPAHTPERYVRLLKQAHELNRPIQIHGKRYAFLRGLSEESSLDGQTVNPVGGDIVTFTNIDRWKNWFDMRSKELATDKQVEEIELPDYLKPDAAAFSYYFRPDDHLLVFETYSRGDSLSPRLALRFFERLFDSDKLAKEYGSIFVTAVPERHKVDEALQLAVKRKFLLRFENEPNPDDVKGIRSAMAKKLKDSNARAYAETYEAADETNGLELDDETKLRARAASMDGYVLVEGRDKEGLSTRYDTREEPVGRDVLYEENSVLPFELLKLLANEIAQEFAEWLKNPKR